MIDTKAGVAEVLNITPTIQVLVYDVLEAIPDAWDRLIQKQNLLLGRRYFSCLPIDELPGIKQYYLLFVENGDPIGVAYLQLIVLDYEGSVQQQDNSWLAWLKYQAGRGVAKLFNFRVLVCGSTFLTGPHGYYFRETVLEPTDQLVMEAMEQMQVVRQEKVNLLVVKDLSIPMDAFYQEHRYCKVPFQPAMVLYLDANWKEKADYLSAMTSKYRIRAKNAAKKMYNLSRRRLSTSEVMDNEDRLYALYQEIALGAGFNMALLPISYFSNFKKAFPERFQLIAYYDGTALVGFCTTFYNVEGTMEAHFLGFERKYNQSHKLYLNMLFDMVEMGITAQVKRIHFARTAMEIKSSVGAIPKTFHSYLRYEQQTLNRFLPLINRYLAPKPTWKQRHPFKGERR